MAQESDIIWMSALEISKAIRDGKLSPVEVVEAFLNRIHRLNHELNAFITLTEERARKEAEFAENAVKKRKKLGPLHGVPVAIKDNIPVKGIRTTYGSKLYQYNVSQEDAILVERLRQAGAIILGKTNIPEFSLIATTDNPISGPTRNPWDTGKTPGGSSGGSAVAVAAGMCPIAIGNDAGGSIRIPCSFCGVFGLKPHFGRVPRYPTLPIFENIGVEGPITRTVADAALVMDVIAGPDDRDYLSLPAPGISYLKNLEKDVKKKKFAFSPDLGYQIVGKEVDEVVRKTVSSFANLGYQVEEVKLNLFDMGPDYVSQVVSEMAAFFGNRIEEWKKVIYPPYLNFIQLADNLKATDFASIQIRRKEIWEQVRKVFEKYDFLITPVTGV
ncbi:MAG: amidase, partial [Candidatus Jordarchaeaceae archaeon]